MEWEIEMAKRGEGLKNFARQKRENPTLSKKAIPARTKRDRRKFCVKVNRIHPFRQVLDI